MRPCNTSKPSLRPAPMCAVDKRKRSLVKGSLLCPSSLSLFSTTRLSSPRREPLPGKLPPAKKKKKKHNKGFDLFLCGFFSFLREVVFPGTCEQEGLAQGIVAQAPNGEVFQISSRSSFFWDDGRGWHGGGGGGRQRLRVFFSSLLETKLGPDHRAFFSFFGGGLILLYFLCSHTKKNKGRPHSTGSLPLFPKKRGFGRPRRRRIVVFGAQSRADNPTHRP